MATRNGTLDLKQISSFIKDKKPKHHSTQEESVIYSLLQVEFIKNGEENLPDILKIW